VNDLSSNIAGDFNVATQEKTYTAKAIIITTGGEYSKLGVEGEARYTGKGVSYCATCDGFLFHDKEVAVVGGGDTAVTDALELSQHASKVTVIHRRDQLRASDVLQKKAFAEPKLHFQWDSIVNKIVGDEMVTGLEIKNVKTGQVSTLNLDGVFIAVGVKPNSSGFSKVVDIDEDGNIIVLDTSLRTKTAGIFAAGDIRQGSPRQVSSAVGDGAVAALSAYKYLKE